MRFQVQVGWDVRDNPMYRPATFEPLAGQVVMENGLSDGQPIRVITYMQDCTPWVLRNVLRTLNETYDLEVVDAEWEPECLFSLVDWAYEHRFNGFAHMLEGIAEAVSGVVRGSS